MARSPGAPSVSSPLHRDWSARSASSAAAHTELNKGWDAGEEIGLATLEAIGKLGKAIHEDVGAFRTPEVAP